MTIRRLAMMTTLAGVLLAQSANELFQQGLKKERSEGDLAGAIQFYERAVKSSGQNRKLAAQSLLRIAECQERQGSESARKTYERLLREYGDQAQAVAEARSRMGVLTAGNSGSALRLRLLWAERDTDPEGSISPDGQFLTYPHWETGDLGLRDLKNSTTKLLTNTGGYQKSGGQFNQDSVFSPDGKQIAYNWWIELDRGENRDGYEIRVMDLDGSNVRTVAYQGNLTYVTPRAWSPDGKFLAAIHYDKSRRCSLVEVEVSTGRTRTLADLGLKNSAAVSYSPDGKWLAYEAWSWTGHASGSIHVVSRAGGTPTTVVSQRARVTSPIWSSDGRWLYYGSERGNTFTLSRVAMHGGRPAAEPESIHGEIGSLVQPIGRMRSGALVYGKVAGDLDIYRATWNPVTGELVGNAKLMPDTVGRRNRQPAYSRDASKVAWISSVWGSASGLLVVKDLTSGEERKYEFPQPSSSGPCWSADGKKVFLAVVNGEKNGSEILSVDLETSAIVQVHVVTGSPGFFTPVLNPTGTKLYTSLRQEGGTQHIFEIDLATKQQREIFRAERGATRFYNLAVSPDGSVVYAVRPKSMQGEARKWRELLAVPVSGGEARKVAEFTSAGGDSVWTGGMSIAPDGESLIVKTELPSDVGRLVRIGLKDGKVEQLKFDPKKRMGAFSLHPNGKEIVFQAGEARSEIWIAENLFPDGH